jgi:hypothetical protein
MLQFFYQEEIADTTSRPYNMKDAYLFDSSGNTVERTIYNTDRFDSRNVYKYNKDNKTIETRTYAEDGSFLFTTYNIFDSTGNQIEEGERHADGSIMRRRIFKCDEHRTVVESESDGKVSRFENKYDDEGVLTGKKVTFDDGNKGRVEWKHDSVGNMLEEGQYFMDGVLFHKAEYVFSSLNLLTKMKITDKDNKVMIIEYSYDSQGNLLETYGRHTDAGRRVKLSVVSYEYDKENNWTKRVTRDAEGKVTEVAIRNIGYLMR